MRLLKGLLKVKRKIERVCLSYTVEKIDPQLLLRVKNPFENFLFPFPFCSVLELLLPILALFGGSFCPNSAEKSLDRFWFVGHFACCLDSLRPATRQESVNARISFGRISLWGLIWIATAAIWRHINIGVCPFSVLVWVSGRVDLFVHRGHIFRVQGLECTLTGRSLRRFSFTRWIG